MVTTVHLKLSAIICMHNGISFQKLYCKTRITTMCQEGHISRNLHFCMVSFGMQNSVNPFKRSIVADLGDTNVLYIYWYSLLGGELYRYTQKFQSNEETYYYIYLQLVLLILTPLSGWIPDAWIGR